MKNTLLLTLLLCAAYCLAQPEQHPSHRLATDILVRDSASSNFYGHQYEPEDKPVRGYTLEGKPFVVKKGMVMHLQHLMVGKWMGYNGKWVEFVPYVDQAYYSKLPKSKRYYVPMVDLVDLGGVPAPTADESPTPRTNAPGVPYDPRKSSLHREDWIFFGVAGGGFILFVLFLKWSGGGGGGGGGGGYVGPSRPEETFWSNGGLKTGTRDNYGGYRESSTGIHYTPDGMGNYNPDPHKSRYT
jgi:hypothetical protein